MGPKKHLVYVAGAITPHGAHDHPFLESLNNVRRGIRWSIRVWNLGFVPFCPFLDFLFWLVADDMLGCTPEMIRAYSIEHEKACQVVLVIPNEEGYTRWEDSAGVAAEIKVAEESGIPVVYSEDELLGWRWDGE